MGQNEENTYLGQVRVSSIYVRTERELSKKSYYFVLAPPLYTLTMLALYV